MESDIGQCVQLACIWEATARKAGNVHRFRDFTDLSYVDFLTSAAAIAPVLASNGRNVGVTVLSCVRATQQVTATNSNLGIILLLAPLAAVPIGEDLRLGVNRVLSELDVQDAKYAYQAIRLANPGGMGEVLEQDLADDPTQNLQQVMTLAADRDLVARQYANGYKEVFDDCLLALTDGIRRTSSLEGAIIRAHLCLLAGHRDTLIERKRGAADASEASYRAARVLDAGWPDSESARHEFAAFDKWLCEDGHSRNPGATADLVAAGLFALLRTGHLSFPLRLPWACSEFRSADLD